MVDYQQDIGGNTTLMIRDTGYNVQFWVRTGPSTWNNDQWWSYSANGGSSRQKARMVRGGDWQQFGSVDVGYDQDVSFTIEGAGLGFPTSTITARIQRATVPPPPNVIFVGGISANYIRVQFASAGDGGSPIREWQIGWNNNPGGPAAFTGSNGLTDIGPFQPGEIQYFWVRGRNDVGWSGWSGPYAGRTFSPPGPPTKPFFEAVQQSSLRAIFYGTTDGGTPVREWQLGYGLDPAGPSTLVGSPGTLDVSGLSPGRLYYFWARGRNDVGWGAWSEVASVYLVAGARVVKDGAWQRAVPYVRVNGTWRLARPWVKDQGVWKEVQV